MHAIDSHPRARLTSSARASFSEFLLVFAGKQGETFANECASLEDSSIHPHPYAWPTDRQRDDAWAAQRYKDGIRHWVGRQDRFGMLVLSCDSPA
ncbi:hypothetical protein [Burkholderia ambifaria]|uniref:hypothetical protein n=1 Tax=Burkholderia ambifaria TaxID=152480 RepID=UPI0012FD451E|nr:hypothetical protein [Burkholderia ambifaria]